MSDVFLMVSLEEYLREKHVQSTYNRIHDINMAYHWWLTLIRWLMKAGFLQSQVTFSPLSDIGDVGTAITGPHLGWSEMG